MDELKKLFRRSKSKTRKPSTSSPRADTTADSSQYSSPSRPAPVQRQRSNTLPTNVPPVNTRYTDLQDGRAPETGSTPLHNRKASLHDPVARKPVASASEGHSRARSETRQSSAPVPNSGHGQYSAATNAGGVNVAPAQAYGAPVANYNNVSDNNSQYQGSQSGALGQQPPLPSNARDSINNAQHQQQFSSSGGAVAGGSGAQHNRGLSTASRTSELPIANEQGSASARSSFSMGRETPTRGRAMNPNIPPVPTIPAGLAGRTSMDQPQPLNVSNASSGYRNAGSQDIGKNTIRPVESTTPRMQTEKMRDTSSNTIVRPTTPGSRIDPPGSPGSEKFWESYPTLAREPSFHGSVVHGPYRHSSGTVGADAMEEYEKLPRRSQENGAASGPGALATSRNEVNRADLERNAKPSNDYSAQSRTTQSPTNQSTRPASGSSVGNTNYTTTQKAGSSLSNDFNKSMSLNREPSAVVQGQHQHRGHLLVQESSAPVNLRGIVDLSHTEDTTTDVRYAPPVYHDNVTETVHHIREERITREVHNYHVFHRILPVIDVEVLPAKHFALLNDLGDVVEIAEPHNWSGQANLENRLKQHSRNWVIAETATKFTDGSVLPGPRHFTAMNFRGIDDRQYVNAEGIPTTEQWWIHPVMIDDGARRRGITTPIYFNEEGLERSPVGVNEYGGHTLPTN